MANVNIYIDEATTTPMLWVDVETAGYTLKQISDVDRAQLGLVSGVIVIDETTTGESVIGITNSPSKYDFVRSFYVDHDAGTDGQLVVQTEAGQIKKIALLP